MPIEPLDITEFTVVWGTPSTKGPEMLLRGSKGQNNTKKLFAFFTLILLQVYNGVFPETIDINF